MVSQLVALLSRRSTREEAVETDGVITALERNFSLFVNHRPIYSMVEYRYRDRKGVWRTRRIAQMNAELVRRAGWQVGAPIKVRYLVSDPDKSVIAA
jgi:hypothetical protein